MQNSPASAGSHYRKAVELHSRTINIDIIVSLRLNKNMDKAYLVDLWQRVDAANDRLESESLSQAEALTILRWSL